MSTWSLQPTASRYVRITHKPTGVTWMLQLPESVVAAEGQLLDYPVFHVRWEKIARNTIAYSHLCDDVHVSDLRTAAIGDPHQFRKTFLPGLMVRAEMDVVRDAIGLTLTLTNRSVRPWHDVICDGGCFQAQSLPFTGERETHRTFAMMHGKATAIATVPRSEQVRCCLHSQKANVEAEPWCSGGWFWGHSKARLDDPTVIAMESTQRGFAVGIGYEDSHTLLANSDDAHHCMHSCPTFGDLAPGDSVVRRGWIVCGTSAAEVLQDLRTRLLSSEDLERKHA